MPVSLLLLLATSALAQQQFCSFGTCNLHLSFDNGNRVMTCAELQMSVGDVRVGPGASPGEETWCVFNQIFARRYCECSGPWVPEDPGVVNPNPVV